jgi:hypothetical protein
MWAALPGLQEGPLIVTIWLVNPTLQRGFSVRNIPRLSPGGFPVTAAHAGS